MIFNLFAASLLAAPAPIPSRQPGPDDYPVDYLSRGVSAAAILELVIDEKGKAESCRVLGVVRNRAFASSFCALMQRSAWKPATDVQGKATVGVLRTLHRMYIPGTAEGDAVKAVKEAPDMELLLAAAPDGASLPLDVEVALLADEAGQFIACEPKPGISAPAALQKTACEQALKQAMPPPAREKGRSLSQFVTELKIRFVQTSVAQP